MVITEEKRVLTDFVASIPESLFGPDRVGYILENSNKIKDEDKVLLRKFVNKVCAIPLFYAS